MIAALNQNAGAITGIATVALLLVTVFYAWTTYKLFGESRIVRLQAGEPRVVGYFRVNEVHTNIVQLHVANLSGAAAMGVTARIDKITDWPQDFKLESSNILRDISFMRPYEVIIFDVGFGPELFQNGEAARFNVAIAFNALDGRCFKYDSELKVESVEGFTKWQLYTVDDVARRLKDISETLKKLTTFDRLRVETYNSQDRAEERKARAEQRARTHGPAPSAAAEQPLAKPQD